MKIFSFFLSLCVFSAQFLLANQSFLTKEPQTMFIKNFEDGEKWIETPCKEPEKKTYLTEMLHPQKDGLPIGFSFAHFMIPPGSRTIKFRLLKAIDAMYILEGKASVQVDDKVVELKEKQMLFIPAGASRCIVNIGTSNLQYLSIAEPQFRPEETELLEEVNFQKLNL